MRYYSKLRPIVPGGFPNPKDNKVLDIYNFQGRQWIDVIGKWAWGYIEYENQLSQNDADNYELITAIGKTM